MISEQILIKSEIEWQIQKADYSTFRDVLDLMKNEQLRVEVLILSFIMTADLLVIK